MSLFTELMADKDGKNVNKDRSGKDKSDKKNVKISQKNTANEESTPRWLQLRKNDRRKNLRRLLPQWPRTEQCGCGPGRESIIENRNGGF